MKTKIVEVTNGERNWGKFLISKFDSEWGHESAVLPGMRLLEGRGWTSDHVLVLDLETGEGAVFKHGGMASHDLEKHRIWVCPLFEPFLSWLYKQDVSDLDRLPATIDLPDAEFRMYGHRRPGPPQAGVDEVADVVWDKCSRCRRPIIRPRGDRKGFVCVACLGKEPQLQKAE